MKREAANWLLRACEELTPYATEFRYPTDAPDPSAEEIDAAVALTASIVTALEIRIQKRFLPPFQSE